MFLKNKDYSDNLDDPQNYIWIKEIGEFKKIKFHLAAYGYLFLGIVLSVIYLLISIWYPLPRWIPAVLILSAIILVFYSTNKLCSIKCPKCGYKPSENRKGKSINEKQYEDRLLKLTTCPKCNINKPTNEE